MHRKCFVRTFIHSLQLVNLVIDLEKVVFGEGNCQGSRLTLCSSDSKPKFKTNMVKPRKRRFHSIESDSDTD